MFQFIELYNKLECYIPKEQLEKINNAYLFAAEAHKDQKRASKEPYITHPIAVADILCNMQMDYQCIMAALLHDVLEDTDITKKTLTIKFGDKVASLVDGVSKLTKIKFENKIDAQAENLLKMILAMSKDIRVIIIKLADRLHNMRTLGVCSKEKQRRMSIETLEICSPIANRLGMNNFLKEYEDLSFSFLYPFRYRVLKNSIRKSRGNRKEIINTIKENLQNKLAEDNSYIIDILGREKHIYSIYKKMLKKIASFSEIMDIYGLRIIVVKIEDCYKLLGIIHSIYRPIHARIKDYIAVPKTNGYQSIHTTVLGPYNLPIEIQIRTKRMNQIAENGIAAHWLYKSGDQSIPAQANFKTREWLQGILEIQKNSGNSSEFMENIKVDLYSDEVYVFTPTGKILSLPRGATVVDFAYAIHTDVGNSCIASKIDRRLAPLSNQLSSGQTIEIITAKNTHPNPAWLNFVVTGKSRTNIRYWLKTCRKGESERLGKRLLERSLAAFRLSTDKIPIQRQQTVLEELGMDSLVELFQEIGLGNQIAQLVAKKFVMDVTEYKANYTNNSKALAIKGTEGMIINYAKCCYPILGDPIISFLSAGRGIVVHRKCCNNIKSIKNSLEKYIFMQWAEQVEGEFTVKIKVETINKIGVFAIITNTIAECAANIENVYMNKLDANHMTVFLLISVINQSHLTKIIKRINLIYAVKEVVRL